MVKPEFDVNLTTMAGGDPPRSEGGAGGGSDAGGAAHGSVTRLVAADDTFFHRESLGLSMQALREAGTFCDATVLVDGRTFQALPHSLIHLPTRDHFHASRVVCGPCGGKMRCGTRLN